MEPHDPTAAGDGTATPPSDEQLELSISELLQEMSANPPIHCRVSFNWNGSQEDADQVLLQIQIHSALLRRDHPWLDFSSLKAILFHRDYEQGLRDASARAGRELIPTREPGGLSIAMVVHAADGCELVADAGLALGLLSEDSTYNDVSVNTLRHELCHVDDFQRKSRLLKDDWLRKNVLGVRATFFPMVESLWSEYYANRVSDGPSADVYLAGEEEMLAGAIRDAVQQINEAILVFRVSHDMGDLAPRAVRKVSFVAHSMGYVLGRYAARGLSACRTALLQEALQAAGLVETFAESRAELDRLFHMRASWASMDDLAELEQIWFRVMCRFGLRFEDVSPSRVHIHILPSNSVPVAGPK